MGGHAPIFCPGKQTRCVVCFITMELTPEEIARFWSYVIRTDNCWLWSGGLYDGRYGSFKVGGKSKRAHRIARFLSSGDDSDVVRHTCDNPLCCNPTHLIGGTQFDNIQDMVRRKRSSGVALSDAQVAEIRERFAAGGVTKSALAKEYGVSPQAVRDFVAMRRRVPR